MSSTRRSREELPARPKHAWILRVVHGPDAALREQAIALADGFSTGREIAAGVTLAINDEELSRRHFSVAQAGSVFTLTDAGSTNGTYVDGKRVASTTLREGAVIRAGQTVFVFERQAEASEVAASAIVGQSAACVQMRRALREAARVQAPVLLQGETGTGKEVAAAELHRASGRRGQLVAVNCGAIPAELIESQLFGHHKGAFTGAVADASGFFAAAKGGTIFLDEIAELPLHLQPKLLRVLETGAVTRLGSTAVDHVDARVVAATNVGLLAAVAAVDFRRDLYARLAGLVIMLPALRERRGDVLLLLRHFLSTQIRGDTVRWNARFAELLLLHDWPMNVREVRSVAQRMAIRAGVELGEVAAMECLGSGSSPTQERGEASREPSAADLKAAMTRFAGNVTDVARHFGRNPKQVYRWLERHGLDPKMFRV